MDILGIDIGGSGIKGAPVDTTTGTLLAERFRLETPDSAKPDPMAKVVAEIAKNFAWSAPIGCGFPAPIRRGVALTAANVDDAWIGANVEDLLSKATACPTRVVNDADAAGLAEMAFGAGRGSQGVVLVVTIGTGLGTSLFTDGVLLPNTELGHIEMNCEDAELQASDAVRKREDLSWKEWSTRFDLFLNHLEKWLWPDLIILGGGAIKKSEKFLPRLTVKAKIVPAQMGNNAGIVGAALYAAQKLGEGI
jgi:polyphosphate glucokinase